MKCLILAAGYATRLYPLTANFPKPLLEVQGKTILDWLIDDIDTCNLVDEYVVVTNHKFAHHFEDWAKKSKYKITVVDDGTSSNETRLGAVRDIWFAIERLKLLDDILVIAGDNLLDFSLTDFIKYARDKKASCIMRYYEADEKRLSKSGVATIDENERVLELQEKPNEPKSNWCCPPFYYYKIHDIKLIEEALHGGCAIDAPGSLVAWMCKKVNMYAMEMPGKRYDIGNLESYEKVQEEYEGIKC